MNCSPKTATISTKGSIFTALQANWPAVVFSCRPKPSAANCRRVCRPPKSITKFFLWLSTCRKNSRNARLFWCRKTSTCASSRGRLTCWPKTISTTRCLRIPIFSTPAPAPCPIIFGTNTARVWSPGRRTPRPFTRSMGRSAPNCWSMSSSGWKAMVSLPSSRNLPAKLLCWKP